MSSSNFSLFLGLRYLKPKRTFVSVITFISVTGVVLGVALLIIVTSVMSGFERDLKNVILGFQPHLMVTSPTSAIDNWPELVEDLKTVPNVEEVTPYILGDVLVEFQSQRIGVKINAIEPNPEGPFMEKLIGVMYDGEFDLDGDKAVIGVGIAQSLNIHVGDIITVISPKSLNEMVDIVEPSADLIKEARDRYAEEPRPDISANLDELYSTIDQINSLLLPREVEVTGIFDSKYYEYNKAFIFIPLYLGQELYALGGAVHGTLIHTDDPFRAHQTKLAILDKVDPPSAGPIDYEPEGDFVPEPGSDADDAGIEDFRSTSVYPPLNPLTWMEMNAYIFQAVNVERRIMFLLLFAVIIVAGFCIMNTMITVTVQKRREIGVMKAIGAGVSQIIWVFLSQGIIVGAIGTVAGVGLAALFLTFRNQLLKWVFETFGLELFPAKVYGITELPAYISPTIVAITCGGAMIICALAALVPAWSAACLDPAKALRD